jgi:type I restriction enzyme R subunit
VRDEVRLVSGDYIDLKAFEPAMRFLIDTYIRAEESEKISAFDDLSIVQLIVDRGADAVEALPSSIRKNQTAVAETIENNVRRLIVNESPVDPAYYEKMSKLLDALIEQRRKGAIDYKAYLEKIAQLTKEAHTPGGASEAYPSVIDTPAKRALYNNLGKDPSLALVIDEALRTSRQDGWRANPMKLKRVRSAILAAITKHTARVSESKPDQSPVSHPSPPQLLTDDVDAAVDKVLELAKNQNEY